MILLGHARSSGKADWTTPQRVVGAGVSACVPKVASFFSKRASIFSKTASF